MSTRDKDLQSIQEARDLVARATEAQKRFAAFSQQQLDAVVDACAEAATAAGEQLARLMATKQRDELFAHRLTCEQQ